MKKGLLQKGLQSPAGYDTVLAEVAGLIERLSTDLSARYGRRFSGP